MNDNLPGPTSRKGHQDLLHALILLGTVPLLFFAALKLVEKTIVVPTKLGPSVAQEVKEKVSPVIDRFIPPRPPPPGEAWLREVAAQEQRVVQLRSTPNAVSGRIDKLQERLAALRQHIEQHLDAVPTRIHDNRPLSAALLRLAAEIDQIAQSAPNRPSGLDWKQAYATVEAEERTKYSVSVAKKVESLTAPLKEPHRIELAAITRESRDLKDQIQGFRDQQLDIQRHRCRIRLNATRSGSKWPHGTKHAGSDCPKLNPSACLPTIPGSWISGWHSPTTTSFAKTPARLAKLWIALGPPSHA